MTNPIGKSDEISAPPENHVYQGSAVTDQFRADQQLTAFLQPAAIAASPPVPGKGLMSRVARFIPSNLEKAAKATSEGNLSQANQFYEKELKALASKIKRSKSPRQTLPWLFQSAKIRIRIAENIIKLRGPQDRDFVNLFLQAGHDYKEAFAVKQARGAYERASLLGSTAWKELGGEVKAAIAELERGEYLSRAVIAYKESQNSVEVGLLADAYEERAFSLLQNQARGVAKYRRRILQDLEMANRIIERSKGALFLANHLLDRISRLKKLSVVPLVKRQLSIAYQIALGEEGNARERYILVKRLLDIFEISKDFGLSVPPMWVVNLYLARENIIRQQGLSDLLHRLEGEADRWVGLQTQPHTSTPLAQHLNWNRGHQYLRQGQTLDSEHQISALRLTFDFFKKVVSTSDEFTSHSRAMADNAGDELKKIKAILALKFGIIQVAETKVESRPRDLGVARVDPDIQEYAELLDSGVQLLRKGSRQELEQGLQKLGQASIHILQGKMALEDQFFLLSRLEHAYTLCGLPELFMDTRIERERLLEVESLKHWITETMEDTEKWIDLNSYSPRSRSRVWQIAYLWWVRSQVFLHWASKTTGDESREFLIVGLSAMKIAVADLRKKIKGKFDEARGILARTIRTDGKASSDRVDQNAWESVASQFPDVGFVYGIVLARLKSLQKLMEKGGASPEEMARQVLAEGDRLPSPSLGIEIDEDGAPEEGSISLPIFVATEEMRHILGAEESLMGVPPVNLPPIKPQDLLYDPEKPGDGQGSGDPGVTLYGFPASAFVLVDSVARSLLGKRTPDPLTVIERMIDAGNAVAAVQRIISLPDAQFLELLGRVDLQKVLGAIQQALPGLEMHNRVGAQSLADKLGHAALESGLPQTELERVVTVQRLAALYAGNFRQALPRLSVATAGVAPIRHSPGLRLLKTGGDLLGGPKAQMENPPSDGLFESGLVFSSVENGNLAVQPSTSPSPSHAILRFVKQEGAASHQPSLVYSPKRGLSSHRMGFFGSHVMRSRGPFLRVFR